MYAPAPTERVQTIHAWLQHVITQRIVDDGLKKIPAPSQSQIYAKLSSAMLGYEQCKCGSAPVACMQCAIKTYLSSSGPIFTTTVPTQHLD